MMRRKAVSFFAAVLLSLPMLLVLGDGVRAADPEPTYEFAQWERRMAEHFEAHPEDKERPGSGWKPYNRIKWFNEQRMVDGADIPAGARWKVWEYKRNLQQRIDLSKNAAASWFALGPDNFAGRMLDIEFDPNDPNTVYVGAAGGGIWKSTDSGASWMALDDELPTLAVNAIAVMPSNSNVILIGTGEATNNIDRIGGVGVLKSTDAGLTWNATSLNYAVSSGHGFHVIAVNPFSEVILAGATDGVWRSTDQGDNWEQVRGTDEWTDIKWRPGSVDTVYLVRGSGSVGGVKISKDGGQTFSGLNNGLPLPFFYGKSKLGVTEDDPDVVYVGISNGDGDMVGIYRSTNAGQAWTLQSSSPNIYNGQGWYNNTMTVDPDNSNRVFAGGVQLYRCSNGGTNCSTIGNNVHVDHHDIAYKPGTTSTVWAASDGGIFESTDDGNTWTSHNNGLQTYQFYDICISQPDPLRAWGGTQDNGTDRWVNSNTWLNGLFADGMVCNGHPTNSDIVYGEIQFGEQYKSVNGGSNWNSINNGLTGGALWVAPVAIDLQDGDHLYTARSDGMFRTTNGGSSWDNVDFLGAKWIDISPVDGDIVWTVGAPTAHYTTDDGATWNAASAWPFTVGSATKVLADPNDANTVYVTFSGYGDWAHVAKSTDLGATWQDLTGDFPTQPVNAIVVDPLDTSHIFIGTDVGVWATINNGVNWVPFETGLPNAVVMDLELQRSDRKLRAGTHGRGMWEIDITDPFTSVDPILGAGPINLMLDPPAPNPVSESTILRYAAKRPGEMLTLSVFDVQGRLVERLADHPADGIIRQVRWSTKGVANGVYFAQLRSGAEQKTRKVLVVE